MYKILYPHKNLCNKL